VARSGRLSRACLECNGSVNLGTMLCDDCDWICFPFIQDVLGAQRRPQPSLSAQRRKTAPRGDTDGASGEMMFNGLALLTAPGRVMAPRSRSEQLVAAARARLAERPRALPTSEPEAGAIAIAFAIGCPNADVRATDISYCAVDFARANVRRHRLEDRVHVRHGDLLAPVPGPIDLIVANLALHRRLGGGPSILISCRSPPQQSSPRATVSGRTAGSSTPQQHDSADNGTLLLQLDRRVVSASRAELPALRAALGNAIAAAGGPPNSCHARRFS
jgi:hypothetical protein